MSKLQELIALCKCGVFVTANEHRDYYESVANFMTDDRQATDVDPGILKRMIESDTVIQVQCYPSTPVGCYVIWHYDLDAALSVALDAVKGRP